ncbi:putative G-protein coupled receptor 160 [Genypterus blacodes]|uniref:putative G-protein coupled receptor 160 n=1 Tax=Genypterus blacodes TaxID=154954 RepID=UPI003F768336
MNIPIPSILLALGGKCLLNCALVFLQRRHICRSFVGVFSVSLAIVDAALTLLFVALYFRADGYALLGFRLTGYHVCLLVQVLGRLHSSLRWPVVAVASLDHYATVSGTLLLGAKRARWILHSLVTGLLWHLACLYVFLLSDFIPVLEDVPLHQMQQCWVSSSSQADTALLFLALGGAVLYAGCPNLAARKQTNDQSQTCSRREVVHQSLCIFVKTWAFFLAFLAVIPLLPVGIPEHMELNVAWLCLLSSFVIGVVLCSVCPASHLARGLAEIPPDSFCEWRFKFSLAAEDKT